MCISIYYFDNAAFQLLNIHGGFREMYCLFSAQSCISSLVKAGKNCPDKNICFSFIHIQAYTNRNL